MGGLDARCMISKLKPQNVNVLSLTTIATPHRGSYFADYLFDQIGSQRLPKVYKALKTLSVETDAFSQLTRGYMKETFNPANPDVDGVKYFSYGAAETPSRFSAFHHTHRQLFEKEGLNDGLVSVESSRWGQYEGTLMEVSHLDLINWTNRMRWLLWRMMGKQQNFNAIAFYLSIAEMLAKQVF